MGRLVYVREVCLNMVPLLQQVFVLTFHFSVQDREAEPRFTGPPSGRGDYGGAPRGGGGYGGAAGYGGGPPMGGGGGGGRQLYVSNVCCPFLYTDDDRTRYRSVNMYLLASLQRWLARHEGSISTGWYVLIYR